MIYLIGIVSFLLGIILREFIDRQLKKMVKREVSQQIVNEIVVSTLDTRPLETRVFGEKVK